jgi:hypothetical protein
LLTKKYVEGFGKRSASVDAGTFRGGLPASGSDTSTFFCEIKEIPKRVEEKSGEMGSDKPSASVFVGG